MSHGGMLYNAVYFMQQRRRKQNPQEQHNATMSNTITVHNCHMTAALLTELDLMSFFNNVITTSIASHLKAHMQQDLVVRTA